MALVLHNINGRLYWYDHFRIQGMKNPTTRYVGTQGCIYRGHSVVSILTDSGFREQHGYTERHEYANQQEKKKYGQKRFDELQAHIKERIPEGELAGKYDDCNTYVNEKIDKKYHQQVRYHEEQERRFHTQQEQKR